MPCQKHNCLNNKTKILSALIYVAFLLCLLPIGIFSFRQPACNWDMLGYMALIVKMDGVKDIQKIHEITFSNAKENIPLNKYQKLVEEQPHRVKFASDPFYFEKILPIHVVKPLYVRSAFLFYKMGFTLPLATVMPSIIAYLFIGVFLFYWLAKYLKTGIAFLGGIFISYSLFTINVARLSTPDCLSALFLFIAFYFILEKKNVVVMFLFLLFSVFTRLDNIITAFLILTILTLFPKLKLINNKQYYLMVLILIISWVLIVLPVRQFGWNIFYYPEYARHIDFSRDFDQPVSVSGYFEMMYSNLITTVVSYHFIFFMFLALLIVAHPAVPFRKFSFDKLFLLGLTGIIFLRFLLLPDLSDRFYFWFYLVIIIMLVKKISPQTVSSS